MPDKLMRLWRHDQDAARRPVMLAIAGDSAAGKTPLTRGIAETLGADRAIALCVDDYHRYDRAQRRDVPFTVLHPDWDAGGRPVDALHVHGHAPREDSRIVEKAIWEQLSFDHGTVLPDTLGQYAPGRRNEALAIAQLLLLWHLLEARV